MVIKVVGKNAARRYRTTCTDESCCNILEFDFNDIKFNATYSMGRECGGKRGIVCPDCNQVLDVKDAEVIKEIVDVNST